MAFIKCNQTSTYLGYIPIIDTLLQFRRMASLETTTIDVVNDFVPRGYVCHAELGALATTLPSCSSQLATFPA
jgi:hypothetical protein